MARRVPVVRPRDERLELPSDKPARDWRMVVASISIGVVCAAIVVTLIIAVVTSGSGQ